MEFMDVDPAIAPLGFLMIFGGNISHKKHGMSHSILDFWKWKDIFLPETMGFQAKQV